MVYVLGQNVGLKKLYSNIIWCLNNDFHNGIRLQKSFNNSVLIPASSDFRSQFSHFNIIFGFYLKTTLQL